MNEFVNIQDQSSSAVGADATNEELSRSTAPEEKNIEKYIQTMDKLIKAMVQSTLLQKNVNKTMKDGLPKLQEALDSLVESRRATSTAHGRLKERQKIKRRAADAINPESQMTPAGKKHKDVARQHKEGGLPTTPLFHFPDDNTWQVVPPKKEKKKGNKGSKPLVTMSKTQTKEKQGTTNKPR